jgi:Domain of unknown function (DUF5753)
MASSLRRTATVRPVQLDEALNGNSSLPRAGQGWWSNYVSLEQSATAVRSYEPALIPGLLRTRELILEFPWPGGLVYPQHKGGATYLDSPDQLEAHHGVFERLRELSTPFDLSTHAGLIT